MSLSISDFIKKATKNEPITPPTRVNSFEPGNFPGKYRTYEGGYYAVDDPKYGGVGTIHLRPKSLGANPWSVIGSGVFLENFKGTNRYKIDLVISSAANGYCVLRGEFIGEEVIREQGRLAFGPAFNVDLSLEFLVGSSSTPPGPTPGPGPTPSPGNEISVSVPEGSYQRPSSGTRDIAPITVSGGTGKAVNWSGTSLPLKKSGAGWMVQCSSTTPLGQYRIASVTVTAGGKDYVVSTPATIDIVSCSSTPPPAPPPPSPPPPVPVPVIIDVWGAVQSTSDTIVLGDEDGIVQWASITTVDANGESCTEAEILPNKTITGYLPVPKVFRPIQGKQIKRSVEIADAGAIERFGRREKRVRFSGVDSWGALQQYGEHALKDAARCVEGAITIPGNPYVRSGDAILYDGHEWLVERAVHNLEEWTTSLTVRRTLTKKEIGGVFVRASESPEKTIIRIIKDATNRVDNAVEGVVTQQIDSQRYLVRIVGQEEELEVMADRALFGDLLVGSSVLIGRGTV